MKLFNQVYDMSKSIFGSVRKVIALTLTIVFCYLSMMGKVEPSEFIPIFTMVLGYYFGNSNAMEQNKSNEELRNQNQNNDKYEQIKS